MPLYAQQKTAPTIGPRGPFRALESLEVAIFSCLEAFLLEYPYLENLPPGPVRFDLFGCVEIDTLPKEVVRIPKCLRWLPCLRALAGAFFARESQPVPPEEILLAVVLFTGFRVEVAVLFGEELRQDEVLSRQFTKLYAQKVAQRIAGFPDGMIVGGFMGR